MGNPMGSSGVVSRENLAVGRVKGPAIGLTHDSFARNSAWGLLVYNKAKGSQ